MNYSLLILSLMFLLFAACENPTGSNVDDLISIVDSTYIHPDGEVRNFEKTLEQLRLELNIPGFSAAIVKDKELYWSKGFGLADRENNITATSHTVYHLASLTKPFAAIVILNLVEQGVLNLDDPISNYGLDLGNENITIKHLMTHTSEGTPGEGYSYNGGRFSYLDFIIQIASGKTFCELLNEMILTPLELNSTFPNPVSAANCISVSEEQVQNIAVGYTPEGYGRLNYPTYFGTSAGLLSNVHDLAKFSIALDSYTLISNERIREMYSPAKTSAGTELPYALGWFVDNNQAETIYWHYGWWDGISSLIVKVPGKNLDFIILANSDMLSRASTGIGLSENVELSVAAIEFLKAFVYDDPE